MEQKSKVILKDKSGNQVNVLYVKRIDGGMSYMHENKSRTAIRLMMVLPDEESDYTWDSLKALFSNADNLHTIEINQFDPATDPTSTATYSYTGYTILADFSLMHEKVQNSTPDLPEVYSDALQIIICQPTYEENQLAELKKQQEELARQQEEVMKILEMLKVSEKE